MIAEPVTHNGSFSQTTARLDLDPGEEFDSQQPVAQGTEVPVLKFPQNPQLYNEETTIRGTEGKGADVVVNGPWMTIDATTTAVNTDAQRIARSPFAKTIIQELAWLRENQRQGTPDASPKVQRLLSLIENYGDMRYTDPFSSYLNALFDALSVENRWADLEPQQYGQIEEITRSLAGKKLPDYHQVDKAISQLEDLGLETTPHDIRE